jgi:hypothetical protein
MDIFFADDSTQKSVREDMGTVVALGGVFVEETALRSLSSSIDEIAKSFGIPHGEELKWSPRKGTWIHANLHGEQRTECYSQVLRAAAAHNTRGIVICWDTGRTTLKGEKAFNKCVDYLFERMSVHLEKRNTSAIVVADRPGGGKDQEEQFLSDFVSRIQDGTEYVVPDRILLNVLTTPSHLIRHLQLADLVTGITTAMVCGQHKFAAPLFDDVKRILIQNQFCTIGGTGLKLFPDQLINLYHHVLSEKTFWRVGKGAGIALPYPKFPYVTDQFKVD